MKRQRSLSPYDLDPECDSSDASILGPEYDSDEIVVCPAQQRRDVLASVDVPQVQNKRRRVLDHVLLPCAKAKIDRSRWPWSGARINVPLEDGSLSSRLNKPLIHTQEKANAWSRGTWKLHSVRPTSPPSASLSARKLHRTPSSNMPPPRSEQESSSSSSLSSTSASASLQKCEAKHAKSSRRLRHAAPRSSYSLAPTLLDSESEADMPPKRSRKRKAPSESSDYGENTMTQSSSDVVTDDPQVQASSSIASGTDTSTSKPARKVAKKVSLAMRTNPLAAQLAVTATRRKPSQKHMKRLTSGADKGLDTNLPPLSNIQDIFEEITKDALKRGLDDVIRHLGSRPIRVATMCSGTESPLFALKMIEDALRKISGLELSVDHLFSAEIVPYKQAYIERNFHPPIIFRDITEFVDVSEDDPIATTAYGGKVSVPKNVDIVIAGTSCVDYSSLNNKKKGIDDGGESGDTYRGLLAFCTKFRPAIVILENVKGADWDSMRELYRSVDYDTESVLVDTKDFYLPHTRQRGYMVCFDRRRDANFAHEKRAAHRNGAAHQNRAADWQSLMEKLKRRASSPAHAFLLPSDALVTRQAAHADDSIREVDWATCEIRHMRYREAQGVGYGRPITKWQESGAMSVPENGDHYWWSRQVERIKDFWDLCVLRKALPRNGMYDIRYKSAILDFSQNIDRETDHRPFGISGCITPSGQPFVTDAFRALSAEESLMLQGIPLDRISFTTESRAELQDLAGNAMSTTVVGAAILAALICGGRLIDRDTVVHPAQATIPSPPSRIVGDTNTTTVKLSSTRTGTALDLTAHLESAEGSLRRCFCEGGRDLAKKPIQKCIDCGHTTCTACGGNPSHNYRQLRSLKRTNPSHFEQQLKRDLPLRLVLNNPAELTALVNKDASLPFAQRNAYLGGVAQATSGVYHFSGVRRTHCWTVTYVAKHGRLELVFDDIGNDPGFEWRLYAVLAKELPSNDWLRTRFEQPIGKCEASVLLPSKWSWSSLVLRKDDIRIVPKGAKVASWWNRMEMEEQYWVPQRLVVTAPAEVDSMLEHPISGTYEYLPDCGKACNSLFKKGGDEPLFLFLDPARTGRPEQDCFVFSTNISQLEYGETRRIIARLAPSWRPWSPTDKGKVLLLTDSVWLADMKGVQLRPYESALTLSRPKSGSMSATCKDLAYVLGCSAVTTTAGDKGSTVEDLLVTPAEPRFPDDHMWIIEALRRELPDAKWRDMDQCEDLHACHDCAPGKPSIRWKLDSLGRNIVPYETPKDAIAYERAIKARPSPLVVRLVRSTADHISVDLAINLRTMAHRALARLPSSTGTIAWKLISDLGTSTFKFKPFNLLETQNIKPDTSVLNMAVKLFPKQRLSLAWMRAQEAGKAFTIEQAEEAGIAKLGISLLVRAQTTVRIRGGICADHPGFGKTITSLALIHSQFRSDAAMGSIIEELEGRRAGEGLLVSCATLIVSPSSLVKQWREEIDDKLPKSYKTSVLTVNNARELDKCSINAFQKAKIIIVNRTIFNTEAYAERLANFIGIPGPAANTGRAYYEWLKYARKEVPSHLAILKTAGEKGLKQHVKTKYRNLVHGEEFDAVLPSRRLRGQAYVDQKKKSSASNAAKAPSASIDTENVGKPLFEMFYFNRVIVDEAHQLEPKEYFAIRELNADKRWLLTATPALDDLYDISRLAGLLGIPLRVGSDARGIMKARNSAQLRKDMTNSEKFLSMLEVPSTSVLARIYETAKSFLDTFVRRNIMDFAQMEYTDSLIPVILNSTHLATYTELSQHLNSQEMKIRKGTGSRKNKLDREERLHVAVNDSLTAEEALSKTAQSFFEDAPQFEGTSIKSLLVLRKSGVSETLEQMQPIIIKARAEEVEALRDWIHSQLERKQLGDQHTIDDIMHIINETGSHPPQPNAKGRSKSGSGKGKAKANANFSDEDASSHEDGMSDEDASRGKDDGANRRKVTTELQRLAKRLLSSRRSCRYLENVAKIHHNARKNTSGSGSGSGFLSQLCEQTDCHNGTPAGTRSIAVSALCGHAICKDCFQHMQESHRVQCGAPGCGSSMQHYHLLWSNKMKDIGNPQHSRHSAKIEAAVRLLRTIAAKNEQAVLFVQYDSQVTSISRALEREAIPATVVREVRHAANAIAAFRSSQQTVIVLNASDETAAGSNLQNANHVIFLAPLLRDSQYGYDSTMAQAIGRVRRHGQKRPIHVYRIVALDTIDVDILEHRELRTDAITEVGAPAITPPAAARKLDQNSKPVRERTQLVRDEETGKCSLRPHSWLVRCSAQDDPEASEKVKGKNRVLGWEDFSSLIKFSRAYTEDDE